MVSPIDRPLESSSNSNTKIDWLNPQSPEELQDILSDPNSQLAKFIANNLEFLLAEEYAENKRVGLIFKWLLFLKDNETKLTLQLLNLSSHLRDTKQDLEFYLAAEELKAQQLLEADDFAYDEPFDFADMVDLKNLHLSTDIYQLKVELDKFQTKLHNEWQDKAEPEAKAIVDKLTTAPLISASGKSIIMDDQQKADLAKALIQPSPTELLKHHPNLLADIDIHNDKALTAKANCINLQNAVVQELKVINHIVKMDKKDEPETGVDRTSYSEDFFKTLRANKNALKAAFGKMADSTLDRVHTIKQQALASHSKKADIHKEITNKKIEIAENKQLGPEASLEKKNSPSNTFLTPEELLHNQRKL